MVEARPPVDTAVRNSFGLRLPVLGPVMAADMVGLDLTLAIHDYVLPHLNASPDSSSTLREHVRRKELGAQTGSSFLKWSDDSIRAVREQLTTYLLERLCGSARRPTYEIETKEANEAPGKGNAHHGREPRHRPGHRRGSCGRRRGRRCQLHLQHAGC